ncbi:MAG: hypothetical protein NTV00_02510 [Methylococcales bacterium]|nr:hypothetical protein [Methylococcales bacterium]
MKRSNVMGALIYGNVATYKRRVAYHEAGHAAAIHFNNRLKQLPPVFFKILLEDIANCASSECVASIKGGRLIQGLPFVFNDGMTEISTCRDSVMFRFTEGYHPAFEADIVNLLVGPLAEAKCVALMDDELFHPQLLLAHALKNYGGEDDLAVVNDYLHSYSADKQVRDESLTYFLNQAFYFVNDYKNWKAITRLADYILASDDNEISCEEAVFILDRQ